MSSFHIRAKCLNNRNYPVILFKSSFMLLVKTMLKKSGYKVKLHTTIKAIHDIHHVIFLTFTGGKMNSLHWIPPHNMRRNPMQCIHLATSEIKNITWWISWITPFIYWSIRGRLFDSISYCASSGLLLFQNILNRMKKQGEIANFFRPVWCFTNGGKAPDYCILIWRNLKGKT